MHDDKRVYPRCFFVDGTSTTDLKKNIQLHSNIITYCIDSGVLVLGKGKGKGKGPPYGKGVNGIKGSDGKGLLQGPGKGRATGGRPFDTLCDIRIPTDLVFFIRFTGPRHRWLSRAVKARRPEPGCKEPNGFCIRCLNCACKAHFFGFSEVPPFSSICRST